MDGGWRHLGKIKAVCRNFNFDTQPVKPVFSAFIASVFEIVDYGGYHAHFFEERGCRLVFD